MKNVIQLNSSLLKVARDAELKYYLLSPRNPPEEFADLHNKVFDFWLSVWRPTLADLKYDDSHLHDDFIRQDIVSCIVSKDQVVGVLLFSFYALDVKASKEFRYMQNYNDEFFEKINALGVRTVMSIQYLAVHPEWRGKKNPKAPIGLLIAGLSNRVLEQYGIDAGIAPTRNDHKVTDLFCSHGSQIIVPNVESHNVSCDLIAALKGQTHKHPLHDIAKIEDTLWENRIEALTGVAATLTRVKKSA